MLIKLFYFRIDIDSKTLFKKYGPNIKCNKFSLINNSKVCFLIFPKVY